MPVKKCFIMLHQFFILHICPEGSDKIVYWTNSSWRSRNNSSLQVNSLIEYVVFCRSLSIRDISAHGSLNPLALTKDFPLNITNLLRQQNLCFYDLLSGLSTNLTGKNFFLRAWVNVIFQCKKFSKLMLFTITQLKS